MHTIIAGFPTDDGGELRQLIARNVTSVFEPIVERHPACTGRKA